MKDVMKLGSAPLHPNKPALIKIPYHGVRASFFVFHPTKQWNLDTRFAEVIGEFRRQLHSWYDVVDLYQDEMVLSEKVTTDSLKREINKITNEIEETQNPYMVEALAEALWDKVDGDEEDVDKVGRKVERHELPYFTDLEKRAGELKAMDLGLRLETPMFNAQTVIKRSFTG